MIRALSPLACLLALAACASRGATTAAAPENPAQAECRQEARESIPVRDLARQLVIGNQAQMDRVQAQQREAESRAYSDCLRRRGLARGGGVEPVRRASGF
jgi:uncharacterized lipoprotein YajG